MVASSLENCANGQTPLRVRFLYFGLGDKMSQHSVEIHAFLFILVSIVLLFQCIILSIMINFASDIRAIRMKLRLMGYKLATEKDIKEYEKNLDG